MKKLMKILPCLHKIFELTLDRFFSFLLLTPLPPRKYDINKDIDAFARRLTLIEYHTPENREEIIDSPGYQPSILQKLNRKIYTRPSREPYGNTYIDRLRQEITDETDDFDVIT